MDGLYSTLSERGYWSTDEKGHSGMSVGWTGIHVATDRDVIIL